MTHERQIFINDKSNTLTLKLLFGVGIIALLILSYPVMCPERRRCSAESTRLLGTSCPSRLRSLL